VNYSKFSFCFIQIVKKQTVLPTQAKMSKKKSISRFFKHSEMADTTDSARTTAGSVSIRNAQYSIIEKSVTNCFIILERFTT